MINPRVCITPIEVKFEPGICCVCVCVGIDSANLDFKWLGSNRLNQVAKRAHLVSSSKYEYTHPNKIRLIKVMGSLFARISNRNSVCYEFSLVVSVVVYGIPVISCMINEIPKKKKQPSLFALPNSPNSSILDV